MSMKKQKRGKCACCNKIKIITRDHVVSKNLFPKEYDKKNIIIAPYCQSCNNNFSLDEEFFRLFICNLSIEYSKEANSIFYTKIKRSIQRRPSIGHKMMNSMELINLFSEEGKYLGKKTKINISKNDWKRYFNVLDKIIKGLFFKEFNAPISNNFVIEHHWGNRNNKNQIDILKNINKWNRDNEKVFAYGYNFIPESSESIWMTVFYDSIFFISFVVLKSRLKKIKKRNN